MNEPQPTGPHPAPTDDELVDLADDAAPQEDSAAAESPEPAVEVVEEALDQIIQQAPALPGDKAEAEGEKTWDFAFRRAAAKVREFPKTPGIYLLKDVAGRVIYIGKAKSLRSRAGSYFLVGAQHEYRTAPWVHEIADADFVECESEVDAILMESRLIKDVQPKYNKELKDDKTFPYLMIVTGEDFPRVEVTRQPRNRGVKLFGPFASAGALRGAVQVLQKIFKFRTCSLDIDDGDERWRWFRPCLLASIRQCTAPCNLRISKDEYKRDIRRLVMFLEGNKKHLVDQMRDEMQAAAKELQFEQAARLRDEIQMLERLDRRGEIDTHAQPEVFYIDPKRGLAGLKKVLKLDEVPRTVEGVDIAHLGGGETVASVVQFLDGLPFKPGYRRYKIRGIQGVDDFRSIHEVIARRYRSLSDEQSVFPDILLIDGGKGQLNAALAAFRDQGIEPPTLLSLAKQEEEIFLPGEAESLKLSRRSFALRLLQYVRDEAHRFAQHYHHILRRKSQLGQ
ncbi:MAG TPA: excinuclease ABC subunit UvrC [Pirellulaceae bacterium]|nr:excinuclease ABC subunit UvrC [Pirellulaceae bacterium]